MNKIFVIVFTIMLLSTIGVSIVDARDWDEAKQEIEILPSSDIMTGPGDYNNIANNSFIKEHELIENDINIEGIYWGPYAACGQFEWDRTEGINVLTESVFNFTYQDIINGASEFWVRCPIIWNSGLTYISVAITTVNPPNTMTITADGTESNYTAYGDYGTYFKFTMPILPDSNITINTQVETVEGTPLNTRMSIERCQVDYNTTMHFFKIDDQGDLIYNYTETLTEIYLAYAFIFTEGIGQFGHHALKLQFYDVIDGAYFRENQPITFDGNDTNDTFISLYIPFRQPSRGLVDWRIEINFSSDAAVLPGETLSEFDGGGKSIIFWVNDTENFLLCSTPLNITGNTSITHITLKVQANKEIYVLMNYWTNQGAYNYINNQDPIRIGHLNWFYVLRFTEGQWAEITPGHEFHIYNFGWGRGYRFPGDAAIYFFLNNETSILLRGNLEGLRTLFAGGTPEETGPWYESLWLSIKNMGSKVYGWIKWVWDGIKELGNWVYTMLIGLKDWIVSIVGHIKDLVSNILVAAPYAAPILAIIAVARIMSPSTNENEIKGDRKRNGGKQ